MTIQFSHANGFPAPSYQCLFSHLSGYKINYIDAFGVPPYTVTRSWKPLVDLLIRDIESKADEKVVGIGHSLGGILTYFAAQKRPDLFEKIILLDPPMFRYSKRKMVALLDMLNLIDYIDNPSKKAKTRKTHFKNYSDARQYLEKKHLFRNFDPFCFEGYILEGFVPNQEGLTLKIPAQQEYQIFRKLPSRFGAAPEVPGYFIYAAELEVLDKKDIDEHQRRFENFTFLAFPGGHMFPFEKPYELAQELQKILLK